MKDNLFTQTGCNHKEENSTSKHEKTIEINFCKWKKDLNYLEVQNLDFATNLRLRSSLKLYTDFEKTPVQDILNGDTETDFSFHGRKENHDCWSISCK